LVCRALVVGDAVTATLNPDAPKGYIQDTLVEG
jgi:hypothetical protein